MNPPPWELCSGSDGTYHVIEPYLNDIKLFHDINTDLDALELNKDKLASLKERLEQLQEMAICNLRMDLDLSSGYLPLNVAVIGSFSAGKSSTINSLLGAEVCPVKVSPNTSAITKFRYSDTQRIVKTSSNGESTEVSHSDYFNSVEFRKSSETGCVFDYFYPFFFFRDLVLIDTPGFSDIEHPDSTDTTLETIRNSDALIYVLDINTGTPSADELERIERIIDQDKKPCLLLLNKADGKAQAARNRIVDSIQSRCGKLFTGMFLYSAKHLIPKQTPLGSKIWDSVHDEISRKAKSNDQWNLVLNCSREIKTGRVLVSYNGLYSRKGTEFAKERCNLLAYLESLRNDKSQLLQKRRMKAQKEYRSQRKKETQHLLNSCKKLKPTTKQNSDSITSSISLLKKLEKELNDLFMRSTLKKMKKCLKMKVEKHEKLFSTKYVYLAYSSKSSSYSVADITFAKQKLTRLSDSVNERLSACVLSEDWVAESVKSLLSDAQDAWKLVLQQTNRSIDNYNTEPCTNQNDFDKFARTHFVNLKELIQIHYRNRSSSISKATQCKITDFFNNVNSSNNVHSKLIDNITLKIESHRKQYWQ